MSIRYKWNKLDTSEYFLLRENDLVLYAQEKTNDGYDKSETNQLIFNIKKPLDANGQYYKQQAINEDPATLEIALYITNVMLSAGHGTPDRPKKTAVSWMFLPRVRLRCTG